MLSVIRSWKKNGSWKNAQKSFFILLFGFTITLLLAWYVLNTEHTIATTKFKASCDEIAIKISAQLEINAQLLRTGAAFFEGSDSITRDEWRLFNQITAISKDFPGIQGF